MKPTPEPEESRRLVRLIFRSIILGDLHVATVDVLSTETLATALHRHCAAYHVPVHFCRLEVIPAFEVRAK